MDAKRVLDLVLGIPIAVALSPLLTVVAGAVLVTSGRPVFLVQTRVGADERSFAVLKFRTMRRDAPTVAKSDLEPVADLYTPLGPFLRRWSLDELPQLVNVLRGEMSLVGPRPALPTQDRLLALRRKHRVTELKPGLTGLAQIEGRESLTTATKVRFEAHYRQHRSLAYDWCIILRTARAIFSRRGAF